MLTFKPPFDALEKDALGRLIMRFDQVSDDDALVKDLKELQPFRNRCAHRGMLLSSEEQKDVGFLAKETEAIEAKRRLAIACLNRIFDEWERLERVLDGGNSDTSRTQPR